MPDHPLKPETARAPRADLPPGTPEWVTRALIEKTQELWGKRGGIPINPDEALGIILRVGTLLDVLNSENHHEQTIRRLGKGLVRSPEEGRVQS
jgi:hypothetical protein